MVTKASSDTWEARKESWDTWPRRKSCDRKQETSLGQTQTGAFWENLHERVVLFFFSKIKASKKRFQCGGTGHFSTLRQRAGGVVMIRQGQGGS